MREVSLMSVRTTMVMLLFVDVILQSFPKTCATYVKSHLCDGIEKQICFEYFKIVCKENILKMTNNV